MITTYRYFRCALQEGILVVEITEPRLHGDLMEDQLRQDLFQAWHESHGRGVVIDFSQVRFVTSAVLRALILLRREVLSQNGRIALCGLRDEHVLRVFTTTRLVTTSGTTPRLFESYPDVAAALAQMLPAPSTLEPPESSTITPPCATQTPPPGQEA